MAAATSSKPKALGLAGHLGVVDDLQQQVAQLFLERRQVVALDGVGHLVGFLDRVRRDGPEGLVDVPGAAVLAVAQPGHDGQQPLASGSRGSRFRGGTFGGHDALSHSRLSYNIYYDKYIYVSNIKVLPVDPHILL